MNTAILLPFGEFCVKVADEFERINGPVQEYAVYGDYVVQKYFDYVEGAYAMACGPTEVAEDLTRMEDEADDYREDYDGQPDWAQEWEDAGEVYDDSYPLYDGGEY